MTAGGKWYRGVAPVAITVDCDGEPHLITWGRGRLRVHDHDVAAERALAALGGETSVCMTVLDAWKAADSDRQFVWAAMAPMASREPLQVLIAQHRLAAERLVARTAKLRRARKRPVVPGSARQELRQELNRTVVLGMPEALRNVLVASVVVRLLRRGLVANRGFAIDVHELVAARALPLLQDSVEAWNLRARGRRPVADCWVMPEESAPVLCGLLDDVGGWVGVGVPASWLVDVWARGIAVVDGCFVLTADVLTAGVVDVLAARWERLDGRTATPVVQRAVAIRGRDATWHLRWLG